MARTMRCRRCRISSAADDIFLAPGHLRTVARAPNNGGCIKLEENERRVDVGPIPSALIT